MALVHWRPFGFPHDPFEEMERMMEEAGRMMPERVSGWTPALDIYQTDKDVIVEMPLAGVSPKDVDISIEDNTLMVKGTTQRKTEVDEKSFYRKEVRHGSFYRAVSLPVAVLKDKASATSENGVLKIMLPKAPDVKAKTVPIKIKLAKK